MEKSMILNLRYLCNLKVSCALDMEIGESDGEVSVLSGSLR